MAAELINKAKFQERMLQRIRDDDDAEPILRNQGRIELGPGLRRCKEAGVKLLHHPPRTGNLNVRVEFPELGKGRLGTRALSTDVIFCQIKLAG